MPFLSQNPDSPSGSRDFCLFLSRIPDSPLEGGRYTFSVQILRIWMVANSDGPSGGGICTFSFPSIRIPLPGAGIQNPDLPPESGFSPWGPGFVLLLISEC